MHPPIGAPPMEGEKGIQRSTTLEIERASGGHPLQNCQGIQTIPFAIEKKSSGHLLPFEIESNSK